jgi:hypothetical protein
MIARPFTKDSTIDFGTKFCGLSVAEVLEKEDGAQYLWWCHNNLDWFELDWEIHNDLAELDSIGNKRPNNVF